MSLSFRFRGSRSSDASARYRAGLAEFEHGRFAAAIEQLAPLCHDRSLPGTLATFYLGQAHLKHGIALLRSGQHADAVRHLSEARRLNPEAVGLSGYLAACFVAQRRFDDASGELQRALQRISSERSASSPGCQDDATPDEPARRATLPIRLAYAFWRDGRPELALETLEDAARREPGRADLRYHLGLLHGERESLAAAADALGEAARLDPTSPDIRLNLGLTLGTLGRVTEAVEHLAAAQRSRPNDAYIAMILSLALAAQREAGTAPQFAAGDAFIADPVEAADERDIAVLGEILAAEPEFVEAFLGLPESDIDPSVFALLARTLDRALERQPDYADLRYHCSRVYDRLGRTDEAIAAAEHAVRANPRYVQALIQLGRLYAATERGAEAIERLRAAIDAGGDYPDVHYLLGELYRRRGDVGRARRAFERALTLNADFAQARNALKDLVAA